MANEYAGCTTLQALETIDPTKIDVAYFYSSFVGVRKPVLLSRLLADENFHVSSDRWSSSDLLSNTNAEMTVKVEYRDQSMDKFGQGKENIMTFHDFVRQMDSGSESLYLTTQELEYDLEDQPEVLSAPLTSLRHDFPLIPSLFCNLIVSNINLWYGRSSTSTSSGLHHDFHDNLYIMLQGEKEITLHSPAYSHCMYTYGEIIHIHSNGRINYAGQPTFADGRSLDADRAWQASQALERAVKRHDIQQDSKEDAYNEDEADDEEDDIDRALQDVLDAEAEDMEDDYDEESDEENGDEDDDQEEEEEDEGDDKSDNLPTATATSSKRKALDSNQDSFDATLVRKKRQTKQQRPDNFSQIDTSQPLEQILQQFPLYAEAHKHRITVKLHANQMLYIPCGWFHEVKSLGPQGHMALNYWFHPPDQLTNFEQPYSSDFWPSVFQAKMNRAENKHT